MSFALPKPECLGCIGLDQATIVHRLEDAPPVLVSFISEGSTGDGDWLKVKNSHSNACEIAQSCEDFYMGLTHCPLCVGLAVLSAVRFLAHGLMVYHLERGRAALNTHPSELLGTVFEL